MFVTAGDKHIKYWPLDALLKKVSADRVASVAASHSCCLSCRCKYPHLVLVILQDAAAQAALSSPQRMAENSAKLIGQLKDAEFAGRSRIKTHSIACYGYGRVVMLGAADTRAPVFCHRNPLRQRCLQREFVRPHNEGNLGRVGTQQTAQTPYQQRYEPCFRMCVAE